MNQKKITILIIVSALMLIMTSASYLIIFPRLEEKVVKEENELKYKTHNVTLKFITDEGNDFADSFRIDLYDNNTESLSFAYTFGRFSSYEFKNIPSGDYIMGIDHIGGSYRFKPLGNFSLESSRGGKIIEFTLSPKEEDESFLIEVSPASNQLTRIEGRVMYKDNVIRALDKGEKYIFARKEHLGIKEHVFVDSSGKFDTRIKSDTYFIYPMVYNYYEIDPIMEIDIFGEKKEFDIILTEKSPYLNLDTSDLTIIDSKKDGWLTYINKDYKVEISYPDDWEITKVLDDKYYFDTKHLISFSPINRDYIKDQYIRLSVLENQIRLNAEDFFIQKFNGYEECLGGLCSLFIDLEPDKRYKRNGVLIYDFERVGGVIGSRYTILEIKDKIFILSSPTEEKKLQEVDINKIFDNILEDIIFTDT